jgi:hypothetical protein
MRLLVKETGEEEFLRKENQVRTGSSKVCVAEDSLGSDDEGVDDGSREKVMFSKGLSRLHGGGDVKAPDVNDDATTVQQV